MHHSLATALKEWNELTLLLTIKVYSTERKYHQDSCNLLLLPNGSLVLFLNKPIDIKGLFGTN